MGELSAATAIAGSTAEHVGVLHVVAAPPQTSFTHGSPLHHSFADGDLLRFKRAAQEFHSEVFYATGKEALETVRNAIGYWQSTGTTTYLLIPQDVATSQPNEDFSPITLDTPVLTDEAKELISKFIEAYPQASAVFGNVAQRRGLRRIIPELTKKQIPTSVFPNAKGLVDESEVGYLGVYNGKLSEPSIKHRIEGPDGRVLIGCTIADTTTGGLSHVFPAESTLIIDNRKVFWDGYSVEAPIFLAARYWTVLASSASSKRNDSKCITRDNLDSCIHRETLNQVEMWTLLSQHMPKHGRLFAETGSPHYGALDSSFPPDTAFECASLWSAIGYALPAALGASMAESSRRVLAVIGDGAAQMTVNELGLIDRYGANPILVLVDNEGYTVERVIRGETATYNDIASWRWIAVPDALGASTAITTLCNTAPAFTAALKAAYADESRAHILIVPFSRYDATDSLLKMGRFLRAKAGLPSLDDALKGESS